MHAHVRGSLLVVLSACLVTLWVTVSAAYVPVPIVEVGKPHLTDIAYSPDGRVLATLTADWIELLDTDTFEPAARFGRGGGRIEFSPDGLEIAVFRYDEPGSIYDVLTLTSKEDLPATRLAWAFSPDWRRLAYSDGDIVYVWDRDTQTVTATLEGDPEPSLLVVRSGSATSAVPRQRVNRLAFYPDGVRLLVASYRQTVAVWDSFSGELLRHYRIGPTWVQEMSVRPDGEEFAVYTGRRRTLVWRFDDPEPKRLRAQTAPGYVSEMQYDHAAGRLWSTGRGFLHRLDTDDGSVSTGWTHRKGTLDPPYTRRPTFDARHGKVATAVGVNAGAIIPKSPE